MEYRAGWRVVINVPQPNGREDHHVWIVAVPDENEMRQKMLLAEFPCEAEFEQLSADDLSLIGIEPGQVCKLTASPMVTDEVLGPSRPREEDATATTAPNDPEAPDMISKASQEDLESQENGGRIGPDQAEDANDAHATAPRSGGRLWRRLRVKRSKPDEH